jgi:D-alanyl-D-alanine carboxypeptidase
MKHRRRTLLLLTSIILATIFGSVLLWERHALAPEAPAQPQSVAPATPEAETKPKAFDKTALSTTDPTSLWVVVNKQHPLQPISYAPTDLRYPKVALRTSGSEMYAREETATALESMFAAAAKNNIQLMLASGYRSYSLQTSVYNGYVRTSGQAQADTFSARPGHSEHQTGLAVDVEPANRSCEVDKCFGDTVEGKWVAQHAYEYGFIVRYTPDKIAITGYDEEPWHIRYVGVELATEMHAQGVKTLEEFFGITGGTSY